VATRKKGPQAAAAAEATPGLAALLGQIQKAKQMSDRHEGGSVVLQVKEGILLAKLKAMVRRKWTEHVSEIGYHSRAASRLLKLAATWWRTEIGTKGSDLLQRLPADPQKLEWLCRLTREELQDLVAKTDCRKATRKEVIDLVKKFNGTPAKPRPKARGLTRLRKAADRVVTTLNELDGEDNNPRMTRLRATFADAAEKMQAALDEAEAPADAEANLEAASAA
jgi:hypothetical protein